jgi:DNA-binding NarL/FixJ family response regulator
MLESFSDFEVVGLASDGVEVIEVCRRCAPDVVLMDLSMPGRGGIAASNELRALFPGIRVVAVTMHEGEVYARQAWLAGVSGYVPKRCAADELVSAIRDVAAGRAHFPASLANTFRGARAASTSGPKTLDPGSLTSRELEVLRMVALGHTTQETARQLHISDKTVESHRRNIMAKLGFLTRADLVRFALEYRLIER